MFLTIACSASKDAAFVGSFVATAAASPGENVGFARRAFCACTSAGNSGGASARPAAIKLFSP